MHNKINNKIAFESTKFLFAQTFKSVIAVVLTSSILLYVLRKEISLAHASNWIFLLMLTYVGRFLVIQLFEKDNNKELNYENWLARFRLATTCCGVAWGLATYFIFPQNNEILQGFLILALAGVCAGGLVNLAIDSMSASLFAGALCLFAGPVFLSQTYTSSGYLFVLLGTFNIYVGLAGKQLAKGVIESIKLQLVAVNKEKEIIKLSERQSLHLEKTPMGVIECDEHLNIIAWNKACMVIFGHTYAKILGQHISCLSPSLQNMSNQDIISKLTQDHTMLMSLKNSAGETVHCDWASTILHNDKNEFIGLATLVQDKTAFIASQEKIHQLAYFDTLTKLPNRGLLVDRINQAVAINKRAKTYGMVAFIDLDHFKAINDIKGHEAGDYLLKTIATRLKSNLREQDTAARLGGDEFVLVLSGIGKTKKQAEAYSRKIIEKISRAIRTPVKYDNFQHQCSASIGICVFNNDNLNPDELLRRADISMYLSKKEGRNCYKFYDDAHQPEYEHQLQLKNDLHSAIEYEQFELYLQGQYDSNSHIIGAEVLLRWNHPEHGIIMPNEFIPLAEETGLIVPIGDWLLKKSCDLLKKWQLDTATKDFTLSVNVSAIQFNHNDFISHVLNSIKQSGCNPTKLCIELTESTVVNSLVDLTEKMGQLRAMGVSLAIDDFGTGYSSLSALKDLPINELKIDRSFVKDFTKNSVDLTIVQTILQMGKNLNLRIVAEGVETGSQMGYLTNYGCKVFQGYLFSKPCPLKEFEANIVPYSDLESAQASNVTYLSQQKSNRSTVAAA